MIKKEDDIKKLLRGISTGGRIGQIGILKKWPEGIEIFKSIRKRIIDKQQQEKQQKKSRDKYI
jgi:hypothetical protein